MDVSKTFDAVNHQILLKKLYTIGVRGYFLKINKNAFTDRELLVSIDDIRGTLVVLNAGVLQGFTRCTLVVLIIIRAPSLNAKSANLHLEIPNIGVRVTLVFS